MPYQASAVVSHGIAASTAAPVSQMMCDRIASGSTVLTYHPLVQGDSRKLTRGSCKLEPSCPGTSANAAGRGESLRAWRSSQLKGSQRLRSAFLGADTSCFLAGHAGRELSVKLDGSRRSSAESLVVARLFGPSLFEMEKLRVLFLSPEEDHSHPAEAVRERRYTLTHSDVTAQLTLAVAREFNRAQFNSWYKKFHRDEVLAVWRSVNSHIALHVHCHISGGNWLHKRIAGFRYYIFRKELPVVIEAFRNGDRPLFEKHPELENAPVWVHFHSCLPEFHRRECWGPLVHAAKVASSATYTDIVSWMYHGEPESWPLPKQPDTVAIEDAM